MFKRFEVVVDKQDTELILISGSHGNSVYKAENFEMMKKCSPDLADFSTHVQIGINYIEYTDQIISCGEKEKNMKLFDLKSDDQNSKNL